MTAPDKPSIAIVGGTGLLGSGLARRLAAAGYSLLIGSRTADKAQAAAAELAAAGATVQGASNADAAKGGELVIVTVPWSSQAAILDEIRPHVAGKLVIDTTVPLVPPKVARVQLPAGAVGRAGGAATARARRTCRRRVPHHRRAQAAARRADRVPTCWCSATTPRTARW